jgi:hypothetical protein
VCDHHARQDKPVVARLRIPSGTARIEVLLCVMDVVEYFRVWEFGIRMRTVQLRWRGGSLD